ncbi:hypothetical protein SEVIR_2G013600v4 [Setaria viridis]|uniref:Disease resistance N-terminal domain-containing protein n=1 Tax=Setaria viridis TaxID=4556 RepID=A0A4U6VMP0_SETVI|nr:hypothetical protein SEVIR_2G013600v2 [Setaria viridis]
METIISVVMGELVNRSISFLIDRYLKPAASSKGKNRERLQWMLMRVRVTVEEAEVRRITNEAILQQLKMLKEVMYRGYYMLDTFIQQAQEEEKKGNGRGASRSLSLSKFSSAKRVRLSCRSKYGIKEIEDMLECLEVAIAGMSEFVIFLRNYPPMFRQPYSTYLFIENCMFGRQVEMERVINFLLHEEPPVDGKIGVLPIVGPGKVGKTTLVEHVCRDERVRNHFFRIVLLNDYDYREERQCSLRDQGRIKYQNDDSNEEIFLVIVELVGIVDESAWRRLHSAYQNSVSTRSKIIVTSRSKDIINFGTTQALSLNFLSQEAYWYFFKALLFGSADPEEQPKLASIAVTILDEHFDQGIYAPFAGTFISLNNLANLLKAIPGAHNWRKILECIKENRRQNERLSRRSLSDFGMENDRIFLRRVTETIQYCVVHNQYRIGLDDEEAPNITMIDIISMKFPPRGKFEILLWKSHLPPYHKHIYSCEIFEFEGNVIRDMEGRKRKNLS